MAEIEDQFWRLPVDKQVYKLYPQTLNMSDVVSRVKSCRAVPDVGSHGALFLNYFRVGRTKTGVPGDSDHYVDNGVDGFIIVV
ncbi:unnamed protein product [Dibothriocephalus latus]|uniref:Uncharacterized protein n=1 Tax=Dibothriocephalus latus TaxID=60516 RepID=A0A3P7RG82_DIBLA|nr:unnamed protein product [Dibothriocephalus latus]